MVLKDKAVRWYLKNIEMPEREVQDKPGFMGENLGEKNIFLRDIALPEEVFKNIENSIDEPQELYKAGKNFGYRYIKNSGFAQYPDTSQKKFRKNLYLILRYFESVSYWRNGENELDYKDKVWKLKVDDFIVCRKNGKGFIFLGASSGLWSYLINDATSEAVQKECQGRGDSNCHLMLGPRKELDNRDVDYLKHEVDESQIELSPDYSKFNEIRETDFAENSFADFKEIGFFEYREGLFYHENDRYIWTEASLIYLLGKNLGSKYEEELFNSSFKYGKRLAEEESEREMEKFITEYLSACGWGDTLFKQNGDEFKIHARLFPWTQYWEETNFPIYRGLVSGLITGFSDREVRLEEVEKDTKGEGFTIIVSES